jgi:TolA-binding protein
MRTSLKLAAFAVLLGWAVSAQAQWTWTPQTGRFVNTKRMPRETAELQIEYTRGLLVEGNYRKALRETDKFTEFFGKDTMADENQYLRAEILFAQGKLMDAAKAYQHLLAGYPSTKRYPEAIKRQYEIGDQYYEKGLKKIESHWALFKKRPLKHAAEVYAMVVENQPFTAQAAEAQYKIGLSHYARKEYTEAAFEYRRVVEDYSGSDWVDDACYGLAMCYYNGSLKPSYDQTPSQMALPAGPAGCGVEGKAGRSAREDCRPAPGHGTVLREAPRVLLRPHLLRTACEGLLRHERFGDRQAMAGQERRRNPRGLEVRHSRGEVMQWHEERLQKAAVFGPCCLVARRRLR